MKQLSLNKWISLVSVAACLIGLASPAALPAAAETEVTATQSTAQIITTDDLPYMSEYLADLPNTPGTGSQSLSGTAATDDQGRQVKSSSDEEYTSEPVVLSTEEAGTLHYTFTVAESGLYSFAMDYRLLGEGSDGVRSLLMDGQSLYREMDNIYFHRSWEDTAEPVINSLGDEVLPNIQEVPGYHHTDLQDGSGYYTSPLLFRLTPGTHTLSLVYVSQDMYIREVTMAPYVAPQSYAEVSAAYDMAMGQGKYTFQAEEVMSDRNSAAIRLDSHGDPSTVPHKYGYKVYNAVGGEGFRKGNQTIQFTFEVPADGLYQLVLRAGQMWNEGMPSYRTIKVDGVIPFAELAAYRFEYDDRWQTVTLGGDKPYLFPLTAGTHTLDITVTMGEITPIVHTMYRNMTALSDIVLDISRLTGNEPDPNYDYKFFHNIPTLEDDLWGVMNDLQSLHDRLMELSGGASGMTSNLVSVVGQLEAMLEDPFSIAARYNQLTSAQSSLGSWYMELQYQPLGIDELTIAGAEETVPHRRSTFFQRLKSGVVNFYLSFKKDYNSIGNLSTGDVPVKETIDVWISRGTEWAEAVKELADADFTPNSGISVRMKVVPASQLNTGAANMLLLSIISGNEPDVAMGVAANSPVEFAIRDAVVDLSTLPGFDKVKERFLPSIFTPYEYRDGIYAIPETMNFTVMFYRKDILSKYGIALPDTRDDLYHKTLPALFKNGMSYYQPADFNAFLYQHGGSYYTEDGMKSALDSAAAYDAFVEYSQMYTHYGVPVNANFFNRFRTGEMPLGIGAYDLYLQLLTSAPELVGKWDIAPVPGIKQADGSVNRAVGGIAGECDILLKKGEGADYSAAFAFLDWWSSDNVQRSYATQIESLIGVESRWNTANRHVFLSLDWTPSHVRVFEEMWTWARETPVVLGGYYTSRHLTNAYTNVVVSGNMSVRDALETAVKAINRELKVKQEEYGVYADD